MLASNCVDNEVEVESYINNHVKNATAFLQEMTESDSEVNPTALAGTSKPLCVCF